MNALLRVGAVIVGLLSAGIVALLISVATDDSREIRPVGFTLFAIGAVLLAALAVWLWRRATARRASAQPPAV